MKSVYAESVDIGIDDEGVAILLVAWFCERCGNLNFDKFVTDKVKSTDESYEIKIKCPHCEKKTRVILDNFEPMW